MPASEFSKFENVKAGSAVKYGVQSPESGTTNGGSKTNLVSGKKSSYIDRVSLSTVKRK